MSFNISDCKSTILDRQFSKYLLPSRQIRCQRFIRRRRSRDKLIIDIVLEAFTFQFMNKSIDTLFVCRLQRQHLSWNSLACFEIGEDNVAREIQIDLGVIQYMEGYYFVLPVTKMFKRGNDASGLIEKIADYYYESGVLFARQVKRAQSLLSS